jgi:hypothetical protein
MTRFGFKGSLATDNWPLITVLRCSILPEPRGAGTGMAIGENFLVAGCSHPAVFYRELTTGHWKLISDAD